MMRVINLKEEVDMRKGSFSRLRHRYDKCDHRDESTRFNPKLEIPNFEGKMQLDNFLDWLSIVEQIFAYYDALKQK